MAQNAPKEDIGGWLNPGRIFCGSFPAGVVWADRTVMEHGDYKRLAFLSYSTLELKVQDDCPPSLLPAVTLDAARIQAKRGQNYQVSTCGQTVLLGG